MGNSWVIAVVSIAVILGASAFAIYEYSLTATPTTQQGRLKVIATFYPIYDFAQNVCGDRANVTLLVPMTVDVHDYEPTPSDLLEVASADVLIFNGAGLEPWINQLLSAVNNPKLIVIDTSQGIPLLPVPSQFQRSTPTDDPHIWLDPVLAKMQVANILQGLIRADPEDQNYFTENAQAYEAKLDQLNLEILNETRNTMTHSFVTFHESFAYFANEYNLTQISILGPFNEEPTPNDIQHVIDALHQYHLCYVGYESLENPAIAQSVASQANATLIHMDPIEGLTKADQAAGVNYLLKMQEDVTNILEALNSVGCN